MTNSLPDLMQAKLADRAQLLACNAEFDQSIAMLEAQKRDNLAAVAVINVEIIDIAHQIAGAPIRKGRGPDKQPRKSPRRNGAAGPTLVSDNDYPDSAA